VGQGKISAERALSVYGVVVDPVSHTLDEPATTAARSKTLS
jgi:hypothetical protein